MLAQRVTAIALGYEDLNDHQNLRIDPVLQLAAGKPPRRRYRWLHRLSAVWKTASIAKTLVKVASCSSIQFIAARRRTI